MKRSVLSICFLLALSLSSLCLLSSKISPVYAYANLLANPSFETPITYSEVLLNGGFETGTWDNWTQEYGNITLDSCNGTYAYQPWDSHEGGYINQSFTSLRVSTIQNLTIWFKGWANDSLFILTNIEEDDWWWIYASTDWQQYDFGEGIRGEYPADSNISDIYIKSNYGSIIIDSVSLLVAEAGWNLRGVDVAQTNTEAHLGSYSVVVNSDATPLSSETNVEQTLIPIFPCVNVTTLSFWYYSPTEDGMENAGLFVMYDNTDSEWLNLVAFYGSWVYVNVTEYLDLNRSIATFGFFNDASLPDVSVYFDDVVMNYESMTFSLDIQGDPELNYDFLMNGSAYTTPYSNSNFTSGNITLTNSIPSLTVGHFVYTFSYWSINATDNLTSSTFTVDIGGNTTISLVFSKAIMDIAFDPRTIASETVHLADTGSQLGKMLGVNSFIGGLIMSAIICAIFLFPVMIFKRTLLPMVIMGFLGLAISTGLGFLPFWIDLVLLLIISILFSGKIRDAITGATN